MAVVIGIDYGRKRVGVAASDAGGRIATPLAVLDGADAARAVARIKSLAAEHDAGEIVVGLPRSLDGSLGPMAKETLEFVERIKKAVNMPVQTWDERLTTAQAERAMLDVDMTRAKRREKLDKVSAQIMLQSYLDSRSKKMTEKGDIEKTVENLNLHNIEVIRAADGDECRKIVLDMLPRDASIGLGGSTSVKEIGLLDALRARDYDLHDQYEEGISKEENSRRRRAGLVAQYYITGVNAISEEGEMFFLDGIGNRVAAVSYGPEKVIIVAGVNKLVRDEAAAWRRIREKAAPPNARRFGANTPCAESGVCSDCDAAQRICNIYLRIHRAMIPGRITLVLIDEPHGF